MDDKWAYIKYFKESTRNLLDAYFLKFKDERTKKAYQNVFAMFARIVEKDWFDCYEWEFKYFLEVQHARYMAGEITYTTYAKYYKIISAFSKHCYKLAHADIPSPLVPAGYEDYTSVVKVRNPSDTFHPEKIPSMTEVNKVIAYAKETDKLVYFAILFSLGAFLKTGDFLKIRSKDIVKDASGRWYARLEEDGYMALLAGDFGDEVVQYADAALSGNDLLFSRMTKGGRKPLTERALRKRLVNACARSGAAEFSFNELRNAAAVYTASAGATKEQIAESMRYKTDAHLDRLISYTVAQRDDASKFIHFTLKE